MTGAKVRARRLLSSHRLLLAAAGVYLAYAIFLTWPLVTDLGGQILAPNTLEDATQYLAITTYALVHHVFPFAPGTFTQWNAPTGAPQTWVLNWVQAPQVGSVYLLSLIFGANAGASLFVLLGFVLSGTTMFAVTYRLFGSGAAALLAGFVFAFYPFAVAASEIHPQFMHGWPLVLCVWRLIEMAHQPSRRNALLAGFATAFAIWWNAYFELFAATAFLTLSIAAVVIGTVRSEPRTAIRAVFTATLPVIALLAVFGVLVVLGGGASAAGVQSRAIGYLYVYASRVYQYLLPDANNLLFGHLTSPYLTRRIGQSNSWESALYLGLSVMVLAAAAFVSAVRIVRRRGLQALEDIRLVAVLCAALLAAVAFVCSGPPTVHILGVSVILPSDIIYKLTATWRVYARFVIVIELSLCLMLAYEVSRIRYSLGGHRRVFVTAVIGVILVFDLWARPPVRTVSTKPPAAYVWLREHPGGIVADYPIVPAISPDVAPEMFWQIYDQHALFEGYAEGSESEAMKLGLADLANPQTAGDLADFGVRYVVVHPGVPGGNTANLRLRGYKPMFESATASVWRVQAQPAATRVAPLTGFDQVIGFPNYDTRQLNGNGELGLFARDCRACTGTVAFEAQAIRGTSTLTIRDEQTGQVLKRSIVPAHRWVAIRVPRASLRNGRDRLALTARPLGSQHGILLKQMRLTLWSTSRKRSA
jgi:hypothetical protein